MAIFRSYGDTVSIGDFSQGYPTKLTTGDRLPSPDPGIPLKNYSPTATSPQELWKGQPSLRKVVTYVARQVAVVPLHHHVRDDDHARRRDSNSHVSKLLRNPAGDGTVTAHRLIRDYVIDRMLYDVSCILHVDGALVRIPPRALVLTADGLGRLTRVEVDLGDHGGPLDITEHPKVLGFGWSASGAGGTPATETLSEILKEYRRAIQWRTQQWQDSVKQPMLLTRPADAPKWSKDSKERFLHSWAQWKRSDAGSAGTPILESGMDVKELKGVSPRDAQDVEGRQLTDGEVASFFHIPPELVGARESSFSNITALRRMLYGPVLGPILDEVEQEFTLGLLPQLDSRDNTYLAFDTKSAIAGSPEERARVYQAAVGGPYMTRAEARAEEDLEYLEGTEELITPLNVTSGGQASPQDSGEQNRDPENDERPPAPSDDAL